jgi:hypothetical protein
MDVLDGFTTVISKTLLTPVPYSIADHIEAPL